MRFITTAAFCVAFALLPLISFSQVGIGTTAPKSLLDINTFDADNPSITDGILIPRVNVLPSSAPGHDQDGMLLYLKQDYGSHKRGFHFWDSQKNEWGDLSSASSSSSDSGVSTTVPYTRGVKIVHDHFANQNLNNYNLNLATSTASVFILTETGNQRQSVNITGITGGTDGRVITLKTDVSEHNFSIRIRNENTSSAPENRFKVGRDVDVINGYGAISFIYVAQDHRWHLLSTGKVD